jgi:hypothetical protein
MHFPPLYRRAALKALPYLRRVLVIEPRQLVVELLVLLVDVRHIPAVLLVPYAPGSARLQPRPLALLQIVHQLINRLFARGVVVRVRLLGGRVDLVVERVHRVQVAIRALDEFEQSRLDLALEFLGFLARVAVQVDLVHLLDLPLVHLVCFLRVVGEGDIVAAPCLLRHALVPALALFDGVVPVALALKVGVLGFQQLVRGFVVRVLQFRDLSEARGAVFGVADFFFGGFAAVNLLRLEVLEACHSRCESGFGICWGCWSRFGVVL